MGKIIRNRALVQDNWQRLDAAGAGELPEALPAADVIVPIELWRAHRARLLAHPGRLGLKMAGDDDPAPLADDLAAFALVAVHFPKFTDGRGYSTARLLRERYRYRGELRAVGDVQRDQLAYLERCGFNAFELKEGQDACAALAAFQELSETYQASAAERLPLFRRRQTHAVQRE